MTDPLVQLMQLLPDACVQITYTPFNETSKVEIRVPEYSYYVSSMNRSDSDPISIKTQLLYEVCMREYKRQISLLTGESNIYCEFNQGYARVYSQSHTTLYGYYGVYVNDFQDKKKESCELLNACLKSLKHDKHRSFLSLNYIEELNKLDICFEICNFVIKKELLLTINSRAWQSVKYSETFEIPQKQQELCRDFLRGHLLLKLDIILKFESKVHENLDVSCNIYYRMSSEKILIFTRTYSKYTKEDAEIMALQEFFGEGKECKEQTDATYTYTVENLPPKDEETQEALPNVEETEEVLAKVEETQESLSKIEEKKIKIRYEPNNITIDKDYFTNSSCDRCITSRAIMYWIDEFTGELMSIFLDNVKYVDDKTEKIIKCEPKRHQRAYLISKEKAAIEDQIAELQKRLEEIE